ncbi:unnamed protein product [Caenorhabditis brenneri]
MQPDTAIGQEELRIHDEFDLRNKLENYTVPKLTTTEQSSVKEQDPPIDGDGLEQEEAAPDPGDDGEQIKQPNEQDFGDFSETLKNQKTPTVHVEEDEVSSPRHAEHPENQETPATSPRPDSVLENDSTISPEESVMGQEEHLAVKSEKPHAPEIETRYPSKGSESNIGATRQPSELVGMETKKAEISDTEQSEPEKAELPQTSETEKVVIGPPRPPPKFQVDDVRHPEASEFDPSEIHEDRIPGRSNSIRGGSDFHYSDWRERPLKSEIDLSGIPEVGLPGIPSETHYPRELTESEMERTGRPRPRPKPSVATVEIQEIGLPGIPSTAEVPPEGKPYAPDIGFTGVSTRVEQEISETRYPGKPEATDKEPVGPPRPPPRSKTTKPEKPEEVYPGPPGVPSSTTEVDGPRTPSREGPEFQDPDRRKSEISSADIQGVDHPDIPIRPTDEPVEEKYIPQKVDGIHDPRDFDREVEDEEEKGKEMGRRGEFIEEEEEDEEEDWIKWDLVHFLLLLSPYDKDEVTWWTIIFEAVKCSLRSCPHAKPHWHRKKMELPRVNRHRREDSEFDPGAAVQTTPKPCACQNLENYFEKFYESIGDKRKRRSRRVVVVTIQQLL